MECDWVRKRIQKLLPLLHLKKPPFLELYFHQQVTTVAFVCGKLLQVAFGDRLGVWVWSNQKKRLSIRNRKMSRWNPRFFDLIITFDTYFNTVFRTKKKNFNKLCRDQQDNNYTFPPRQSGLPPISMLFHGISNFDEPSNISTG